MGGGRHQLLDGDLLPWEGLTGVIPSVEPAIAFFDAL